MGQACLMQIQLDSVGLMEILRDTAVHPLGAANKSGLMSNASFLLQWHVIEYLQERGCYWYDLGGLIQKVIPAFISSRHGWGADIFAPGPYETGSPLRSAILQNLESLYRTLFFRRPT